MIEELDLQRLPNYDPATQEQRFTAQGIIDGKTYAVPKDWGTTGFIVNTKMTTENPTSWKEFWDLTNGAHKGRTMVHDYQLTTIGNAHPKVVKAVQEQVAQFTHTCFMVTPYDGYVDVCEQLGELTPGDHPKKSALFNSGAEAVENAVKIARSYTKRAGVLCFEGGYHGRTLLTMSRSARIRHLVETAPVSRSVVARFVAGTSAEEAVASTPATSTAPGCACLPPSTARAAW